MDDSGFIDFAQLDEAPEHTVAELCRINVRDLQTTMEFHAALFAYACASLEMANIEATRAKRRLERCEANVFARVESENKKRAVSRIRESDIPRDTSVRQAAQEYDRKSRRASVLKSLVRGLEHRRDMLVQLSARQRAEL